MHLFISYAKKDTRELALELEEALNALDGVTAWIDRSLRAGRSWELQIQSEIDRCDTMIVLYSPDINRHKQGKAESYVLTEIAYAKYTARKPIIPIMAQPTDPPISLTMEHYIDFTLNGVTLDDLVGALCEELDVAGQSIHQLPRSEDILPPPFAWIDIPAGKVTLAKKKDFYGGGQTFDVPAFSVAKYPMTNVQYAKFIEAGGYQQQKWWTDVGWQMRERADWTKPRFWDDIEWNGTQHPVVGVSWYEAVAFCRWLSETTGENIMLPTEQQWQRAAQGDDSRIYPWGNEWESARCNNCGRGISRTLPVTEHEKVGDSPFGVVDMAGNVWEWCRTIYKTGSQDVTELGVRVFRGGSWKDRDIAFFRCDFRGWDVPDCCGSYSGFRIARSA